MKEKINKIAETIKEDLIAFTRQLISIPSFGGMEAEVVQRLKIEMQKIGYDRIWVDDFGNLLGIIGKGDRLIAIDGHCDTVGIGNADSWQLDPFSGTCQDGIIYGRGASDQKGGLAAAIYAGKIIKEIGLPSNTSLLVVASVLEEDYEGLCWKYIIEKDNIKPEAVLLTEPSDLGIMIGQRGRMEIKIQTTGVSCHGSAPERGENAIYKMLPIIKEIEELNNALTGSALLGKGSVAVTGIHSSAPSLCAVPDSAFIHLDRRLSESESLETVLAQISQLPSVQKYGAQIIVPEYAIQTYTGLKCKIKAYYPMWLMNEMHPLVQTAKSAYHDQFSELARLSAWDFSTNGVATKGIFNIPTIGFGPGNESHAHTAQDQVKASDLLAAVKFYSAFIYQWSHTFSR
ncbi:MAG: selenium metabolism hydrolase [Candidatus Fischerbacteria bacterium RBG_13_37_8]|uniref:Selenium metabolism hydrolase n=1 Tax=Candidatus Fischerbacteria bacterium RBG_13_37_8 TaxID=1817863 RepID=A0A1F5VEY2_9BACT|nr:MAG: selenium metabolism hydrolase [Candidatus Fischerbacteria bacterium RBG_13_37_8]